jgi:hypothetical protein
MRMSEGRRLSAAVAAGLTALVLLVLAGPALGSAARDYLKPDDGPSSTPCALVVGPIHTYCTAPDGTITPARSPR